MTQGKFKAIFSFVIIGIFAIPLAFADSNTIEMESRILDNFDGTPYTVGGEQYHYTWKAVASKFTTKNGAQVFPIYQIVDTAPTTLARIAQSEGKTAKSFGVQGCFDRRGYNWIDIYPTITGGDGSPTEIPLLGRTRALDLWVWGSNLRYYFEAYIRDNQGMIHVIPMGSLYYEGWKNLRATIPESIPMVSKIIPRSTSLTTFVKFRLWTSPGERTFLDVKRDARGNILSIIPFYLYIAQVKVLSDVYETVYDGDALADPTETEKIWSESASSNQQAPAAQQQAPANQQQTGM